MPHDTVDPATQGEWKGAIRTPGDTSTLNDGGGVYPVHMILLRTGRVLMFSGGWESTNLLHRSWTFDPATWDPANPTQGVIGRWFLPQFDDDPIANPPPPTGADDPDIDLFCAHHVQIEDGRVLFVGGDGISSHTNDSIHFYDPIAERWSRIPQEMVAGRWYPTAVLQPDGSVVAFTGQPEVADTEIMSPTGYVPRVLMGGRRQIGGVDNPQRSFPGMFLVPGGRMFYVPTAFSYSGGTQAAVEAKLGNTMSFRVTDADANPPVGVWEDHGIRPTEMLRQEGTAVLLSPAQAGRIALIGGGWVSGFVQQGTQNRIEILETQGVTPQWVSGGDMIHTRANVNAILLPDGKVLIFGGTGGYKWESNAANDQRRFTAEIWDPAATDPADAFVETGEMHRARMYHSSGVLLPDGRVLVAAGEDNLGPNADGLGPQPGERVGGSSQRTMEFYEPPYMHNGPRPTITSIGETGGPDDEIHYGGAFTIQTPDSGDMTVVLMRPGSITHHTDSEQRHIPLVSRTVPGGYRARVVSDPTVAPPGYYMVWIVDGQGRPCERAHFVRLSGRSCRLITDRSQFSIHEVESEANAGVSSFDHAFFVVVEGYRPDQLSINALTPTQLQLDAWAPTMSFEDAATGAAVSGVESYVMAMHLEIDDLTRRQRITFEYGVRFTGTAMFPSAGPADERRPLTLTSEIDGRTCVGSIDLFLQPNPYMVDGATHWLSNDLRVFQIKPGGSQSGIAFPAGTTPQAYLSGFLDQCDGTADAAGHPFRLIATDQQASRLELSNEVDGDPVYNFAVARVHYKSVSTPATDVRLFFRAFTTANTSMTFQPETYPFDPATNLPEVGASATDVLTIPFFSVPRGGVTATGDTENVKTLPASGADGETLRYFGAWLDINATTPAITDPGDGTLKSVQNLIRGQHQCLVAEIRFGPDPIPLGATPANNENLSQRNLAIVESDNPGPRDAHTVTHTFDFKTTLETRKHEHVALAAQQFPAFDRTSSEVAFDELIILWGDLPRDTEATLYLPSLRADDILAADALRVAPSRLEKVDDHTIRCQIADVTFVPLPAPTPTQVAGLMTIVLPQTVKTGQHFQVIVRQHSGSQRRIVGSFEVSIPVANADTIRRSEARFLAVLKSIAGTITPNSRWFSVFDRYLATVSDRVRGLGGNPAAIDPSPQGAIPDGALPSDPTDNDLEAFCEEMAHGIRGIYRLLVPTLLMLLILLFLFILRG